MLTSTSIATLDPRPIIKPLAPVPTLLSFTPTPVYTLGRREVATLKASQIRALEAPYYPKEFGVQYPKVVQTQRGGQITFHGPGQLVLFLIFDLRPNNLTPRQYVQMLEESTIQTLKRFRIRGQRTDNPGVWVIDKQAEAEGTAQVKGNEREKKIAALGVHLRRNITSCGVGLNIDTDLGWYDRIVACGLEGKGVTSITAELARSGKKKPPSPQHVASVWAQKFVEHLWAEEGEVRELLMADLEPIGSLERVKQSIHQHGFNSEPAKKLDSEVR